MLGFWFDSFSPVPRKHATFNAWQRDVYVGETGFNGNWYSLWFLAACFLRDLVKMFHGPTKKPTELPDTPNRNERHGTWKEMNMILGFQRLIFRFYPGTPNNQFEMDLWWFPTIFQVKIRSHPTETTWNNQKNSWWTLGKNLKTRAFDCSFCRRSQVLRWVGCCMVLETRQLLKLVSLGALIRSFYQKYDHFLVTGILGGGVGDSQILFRLCFVKPVLDSRCFVRKYIFTKSIREKFTGWSFFAESEVGYCALAMPSQVLRNLWRHKLNKWVAKSNSPVKPCECMKYLLIYNIHFCFCISGHITFSAF